MVQECIYVETERDSPSVFDRFVQGFKASKPYDPEARREKVESGEYLKMR